MPYEDPKMCDNGPLQAIKYAERSDEIGRMSTAIRANMVGAAAMSQALVEMVHWNYRGRFGSGSPTTPDGMLRADTDAGGASRRFCEG